jgi:hypothetical protein
MMQNRGTLLILMAASGANYATGFPPSPSFFPMKKNCLLLLTSSLLSSAISAQAPVITAATPLSSTVERWGKFEVALDVVANWSNPYDYDEISVTAVFTAPNGQIRVVKGFFMQNYQLDETSGNLTAIGSGGFKVRFAPDQLGTWTYALSCQNALGAGTFPPQSFNVVAPTTAANKGFVRSGQTNYLHFDDGEQYIPVGENMGWHNTNPYLDFKNWVTDLSDHGGNFLRLWHCAWGLGIEWENGNFGFEGLRRYKQSNAFYHDWLLDYCAERGVCVMLCLHHHGQVSSEVNPNWSDSPYNAANGGPCANTWDFFTHQTAKNHVKNRLLYVLARWGYARNVLAWELFNEVDWTNQYGQYANQVADWHAEMATFLKINDPNSHLVTTSFANDAYDFSTWSQSTIDFTQTHYYVGTPHLEKALASGVRRYLYSFAKPTFTGEFGLTTFGSDLIPLDPTGIHVHNSLWGSLFGGGLGAGASWWWDSYIAPQQLYTHFAGPSQMAQSVPFKSANLAPAAASVAGAPADLVLTPTQGWNGMPDTAITIGPGGLLSPLWASFGVFLYGSQWNTNYRFPPNFYTNNPQNCQFKVKTGSETGFSPKIAIWLDGTKVLEQSAQTNQTYTINVPPGPHIVEVDNTGVDWITIANYTFTGLGSALDAYILKGEDQRSAAGWVLNKAYNHEQALLGNLPSAVTGALLQIPNLEDGQYLVRFYDCLSGLLNATTIATASNGTLVVALPDLTWDVAFTAEFSTVGIPELVLPLALQIAPNPLAAGSDLTVSINLQRAENVSFRLFDATGKALGELAAQPLAAGENTLLLSLPTTLPNGLYWLRALAGNRVGGAALLVQRP